jgi:hypothetical protein
METRRSRTKLAVSLDGHDDTARFQIKFLFRDSKQFAGLIHCQAGRTGALIFQVNASLTAVSLSSPFKVS